MVWSEILNEIKKLKTDSSSSITNPQEDKPTTQQLEVPKKHWWQLSDILSRQDELLEAILLQLQSMATLTPTPTPPTPEVPVIPPGMTAKLDVIAGEQIRTKELLEGFNFITGQATVPTPGTPMEVISTVKTYLIILRAHVTNTGNIYVGGKGVNTTNGFILGAGEALSIQIDNTKKTIWINADVTGEGVSWIALVD